LKLFVYKNNNTNKSNINNYKIG